MNAPEHNPLAAAEYLATLGLQQAPYLDSTDARFFYADPGLTQRLDLLQHLTQFGDMLLGVSGPVGSGKTILAQQFLQRGNTNWRSCRLNGAHLQHPDELLVKLAECFGLQASATPERLKAELVRHCQTLRHNTQLAVVVIDDAQQLPDPVLKALLELADGPRETLKLLRVILFSEPGLEQRLAATGWHSPQQPLLHNVEIPRFDEQQTAAYLMYRLAVAGYSGESPFSLTEIRALHKATDGLPGKLNVLAHETLIEHASRMAARKTVSAAGSRRAPPVLVLGLIGSLIAGGLTWYLSQNQTTHEPLAPPLDLVTSAPPTAPATSPKTENVTPVPPEVPSERPAQESGESLETTPEIQQSTDKHNKIQSEPASASSQPATPANTTTAADDVRPADLARPEPEPAPTVPDTAPATVAVTTPAPVMDSPVPPPQSTGLATAPIDAPALPAVTPAGKASAPGGITAAKPTPTEKPQPATVSAPVTTTPGPTTQPAPTPAPEPSQPVATPITPAAASEQLGSAWLQSRPDSHFTLQLLGGRSEKSLREYLRQNPVPEPVATFRTVYKGANWYVLIHGDFENSAQAHAAAAALPANVRKGKPWARSFASVYADIQKTQR
ncbi:MAG: AAA family ATPase [Gammaproteobacteria bacterium]|nr:AAA family ATPase [Gammaproteobacteria bacterium]